MRREGPHGPYSEWKVTMRGFAMICVGFGILILAYMKLPLVEILTMFFYIVLIPISLACAFGLISAGFLDLIDNNAIRRKIDHTAASYLVYLGESLGMDLDAAKRAAYAASDTTKPKPTETVQATPASTPAPQPQQAQKPADPQPQPVQTNSAPAPEQVRRRVRVVPSRKPVQKPVDPQPEPVQNAQAAVPKAS